MTNSRYFELRNVPHSVIPAKAGIQTLPLAYEENLDSRFRGNDNKRVS